MGLEDEARVVIEVAAEARGEIERGDVEPARGDEAEALVEDIEPGAQVETGVLGQRAQPREEASGLPLTASQLSITWRFSLEKPAPPCSEACSRKRSAISAELRPPTDDMPAMERRSCTSARAPLRSTPSSAASTPE